MTTLPIEIINALFILEGNYYTNWVQPKYEGPYNDKIAYTERVWVTIENPMTQAKVRSLVRQIYVPSPHIKDINQLLNPYHYNWHPFITNEVNMININHVGFKLPDNLPE